MEGNGQPFMKEPWQTKLTVCCLYENRDSISVSWLWDSMCTGTCKTERSVEETLNQKQRAVHRGKGIVDLFKAAEASPVGIIFAASLADNSGAVLDKGQDDISIGTIGCHFGPDNKER